MRGCVYVHKSSEYNDVRYPLRSAARYLMKRIRLMDNSFYALDMMYDEPDDPATSFYVSGVEKRTRCGSADMASESIYIVYV